jgi:hypothetical protein
MAAKYGWGNPPWFQIPKWVFSGLTAATAIDNIALGCTNLTRDIRGLCAGDVNGTYLPANGYKMADVVVETRHALSLQNRGTLPITPEMTFPVRADRDMELGAITLMLDFDPAMIEITGVEMPDNGGSEPYFILGTSSSVLEIGWMSLNPVNIVAGQPVLLVHARLKDEIQISNLKSEISNLRFEIRFSLNDNPLSELADGDGNVISGAKLTMPDASLLPIAPYSSFIVYPNPTKEVLNVEFLMENAGSANIKLVTMHGVTVSVMTIPDAKSGINTTTMDVGKLPNGAYLLRVEAGELLKTMMVIVNR